SMRIVYTDLGLKLDPDAMAETDRWLHDYTADLFDGGLHWCERARQLLDGLAAEGTPMALVTNTQRLLTDRAPPPTLISERRNCWGSRWLSGFGGAQRCPGAGRSATPPRRVAAGRRHRRTPRDPRGAECRVRRTQCLTWIFFPSSNAKPSTAAP